VSLKVRHEDYLVTVATWIEPNPLAPVGAHRRVNAVRVEASVLIGARSIGLSVRDLVRPMRLLPRFLSSTSC